MDKKISVALAVFNEEKNLEACLASIASIAQEIMVVNGGSTDKTMQIAKSFGARTIRTDNPPIFHINKQKALDACTSDWILQLDADEVIPEELKKEISVIINQSSLINGYYIPRRNFFWGHWMTKGGQYPDYVIRLVRKGKAHFPCKTVHEQIEVDGEVGYLKNPMLHYSCKTRAEYWRKADAYTSLTARELVKPSFFTYCFIKPITTFFSLYVRHKGFMDGVTGFEFALYSGMHWAIAYKKYIKV